MSRATLLAIAMLLIQQAVAGPEQQQRELDQAYAHQTEVMDRRFQQQLEQAAKTSQPQIRSVTENLPDRQPANGDDYFISLAAN